MLTGLRLENIALIDGLQGVLDDLLGGPVTSFGAGNIILGGAGQDQLVGGSGNDLLFIGSSGPADPIKDAALRDDVHALGQLVGERVTLFDPQKNTDLGLERVELGRSLCYRPKR